MDDESTSDAIFKPDLLGQYVVQLQLVGQTGNVKPSDMCPSSGDDTYTITVDTSRTLVVQLNWNTPFPVDPNALSTPTSDLDLHMLSSNRGPRPTDEWSTAPIDCYFSNRETDWGAILESDDISANGLEKISMLAPSSQANLGYLVGVYAYRIHQYATPDMPVPTSVNVKVFNMGVVAGEYNKTLNASKSMWEVAEIIATTPQVEVRAVDNVYGFEPASGF
jgi:hypothetical protein